jgi:hypothetical protein
MGALCLCFVCIDAMAYLWMPEGQQEQSRDDFIAWVNAHLRGHADQPYQYEGIDVYAARCAVLHRFGAEARMHAQNHAVRRFIYSNGGRHKFDATTNDRLVIIGLASFLNDVVLAVEDFMAACQGDPALRRRVEPRLGGLFHNVSIPSRI